MEQSPAVFWSTVTMIFNKISNEFKLIIGPLFPLVEIVFKKNESYFHSQLKYFTAVLYLRLAMIFSRISKVNKIINGLLPPLPIY